MPLCRRGFCIGAIMPGNSGALVAAGSAELPGGSPSGLTPRNSFIRKWRLKCRGVADSLEEAASSCSPSPGCPTASVARHPTPTPSNGRMRSSSAASMRKPCCSRRNQQPNCFRRCLPPARSPSARSMVGKHLPRGPPPNALTLPLEAITSSPLEMSLHRFPPTLCDTTNLDLGERIWR